MGIDSHLSTCVGTQSPKYLEMAQRHISLSAPSPLLIRGSKAGPSEGFDSRPKACRVRDDPGYVCYMVEAWAALPRYPRTFPRPVGMIL
jgi:hypothetical protein